MSGVTPAPRTNRGTRELEAEAMASVVDVDNRDKVETITLASELGV